ncbi:hypothetical protein AB205_0002650 [Aquarana catesbeiana]|uniref:Uncharacterized protein n=1 Tax=Aquarana catesbeiana TaxID=8400 RepID=A0A2G9SDG5_AQUCT|nr:hypothetical protein AB205_0002650 [Aquarana catesbeiana]
MLARVCGMHLLLRLPLLRRRDGPNSRTFSHSVAQSLDPGVVLQWIQRVVVLKDTPNRVRKNSLVLHPPVCGMCVYPGKPQLLVQIVVPLVARTVRRKKKTI